MNILGISAFYHDSAAAIIVGIAAAERQGELRVGPIGEFFGGLSYLLEAAWLFLPRGSHAEKTVVLALDPSGRNHSWHEGELYQALAVRGHAVCVADVRGAGDLTPEFGRGAAGYTRSHQSEEEYAWASLILGRPLLGQRVTDILALAAAFAAALASLARWVRVGVNSPSGRP